MAEPNMRAGFAKVDVTPVTGTPLAGVGSAWDRRSEGVLDPLFARALYLEQGERRALICGVDTCFVDAKGSNEFKEAVARAMRIEPSAVLVNASHTHAGTALGTYFDLEYRPLPDQYPGRLWSGLMQAARQARQSASEVRLRAGTTRTTLPLNRRKLRDGQIHNAPNPGGQILDAVPLCLFETMDGRPKCLLFSASTHPVALRGKQVSADWPGAAMRRLDQHFGFPTGCSFFLQGCAGDSRPRNLVQEGGQDWNMKTCGQKEAEEAGEIIAEEVIAGLASGLQSVAPELASAIVMTQWNLQPLDRSVYEAAAENPNAHPIQREWGRKWLRRLAEGTVPRSLPVLMQGLQLGEDLRLVTMEGEPLAEHGHAMLRAFPEGTTFPIGYTNGEGMYFPTSRMLDEGGYEVDSYWEFGISGPLAKGMEQTVAQGIAELRRQGIH